jgi:hypothetical protein
MFVCLFILFQFLNLQLFSLHTFFGQYLFSRPDFRLLASTSSDTVWAGEENFAFYKLRHRLSMRAETQKGF